MDYVHFSASYATCVFFFFIQQNYFIAYSQNAWTVDSSHSRRKFKCCYRDGLDNMEDVRSFQEFTFYCKMLDLIVLTFDSEEKFNYSLINGTVFHDYIFDADLSSIIF